MPVKEGKFWRVAHEHFPLSLAAICVNCSAVFEARPICPACTSKSVQSVETYLVGQGDRQQRVQFEANVRAEMERLIRD